MTVTISTTPRQVNVTTGQPAPVAVTAVAGEPGPPGPQGPAGPTGPEGPQGQWESMTQEAYDALPIKDPAVLYVIVP